MGRWPRFKTKKTRDSASASASRDWSDPGGCPLVTVVVGPPEALATAGYDGIFGASLTSKKWYISKVETEVRDVPFVAIKLFMPD